MGHARAASRCTVPADSMVAGSRQTVLWSTLLFVLCLSCCHVFGWNEEEEEGLTAMERFPVRLQSTVVSLDQAPLACPFALLAFDLSWN